MVYEPSANPQGNIDETTASHEGAAPNAPFTPMFNQDNP